MDFKTIVQSAEEKPEIATGEFRILVADDSAVQRKLVEHALKGKSCAVSFAKSGQEALDIFPVYKPDVLITDSTMPDVSGTELCEQIRARFRHSYTYIIILTSHSDEHSVEKGMAAGADDYLTKPFHQGELEARVAVARKVIELRRDNEDKARLLEKVALSDPVTGLPNRRAIEEWAAGQIAGAARHRYAFWVVMAEIDGFQKIPDARGGEAGEAVLKRFAQILRSNTRRSDICGRTGVAGFLLVITHAKKEGVAAVIERIRCQLEANPFTFGGHAIGVTASFGISGFEGDEAPEFSRLVTQADVALYGAKREGNNRVKFAAPKVLTGAG